MEKVRLHLGRLPATSRSAFVADLYRALTGRDMSEQDMAEVRSILHENEGEAPTEAAGPEP